MPSTPSSTHRADARLPLREKLGYGLGDAACNIVFQMVMSFMAYFYTDVFGMEAAAMGTLFLVTRAATAIADPVMGAICDRTHTRWGRFRPYLVWFCVPYAAIAVLAFTTPDVSPTAKLAYAYVTYSLLLIVYAAINVPYCALAAVMTPDSRERVSLNGYRFFLATAGGALVGAATLPLVKLLGGGDDQRGFQLAVALLTSLAVMLFIACFLLTKERVAPSSSTASALWADVRHLARNDQWWIVAGLSFVLFATLVIQDGATVYYITWYVERPELVGPFLATGMVASMIGALFAGPLVKRMSKTAAYALLQAIIVAMSLAMYFVAGERVLLLFVLYGTQQFFMQMASPISWSMIADSADYGEYLTGRRITGLTFSGALLALKLGTALGGALLGWLLAGFGYEGQADTQSERTIFGIVVLFTLAPAIGHSLLIVLVRNYRLDDARCEEIRKQLDARA